MKKAILIGLNELNFEYIKHYASQGKLPNFKRLFDSSKVIETESEKEYKLLEPWIQWTTVHTGKSYEEHKIFRLGDITDAPSLEQLFESLEEKGMTIGAVSPFNADNRLKNPKFFVPDPWTKTKVSGNRLVKELYEAVHQSVNDNAQGSLKLSTLFTILQAVLLYVPISRYWHYFKLFKDRKLPGVKAIILDSLLGDTFIALAKRKKPDFSNLFLNSGAHIQHHYLFNSEAYLGAQKNPEWYCPESYDPLIRVLKEYDALLGRLDKVSERIILATGLHQQPHKHLTFYWRINEHKDFITKIGVKSVSELLPRMSRDFLVRFDSKEACAEAFIILDSLKMRSDGEKVFTIDNRGDSLFVELTYPNDISETDAIFSKEYTIDVPNFKKYISFVAIKNGEHNGIGYLTSNFDLNLKKEKIKLTEVRNIIESVVLSEV